MGKAKKAKNAKLSQDRLNAKARNAAGAAATAGRSRVFADKGDILAKDKGDSEIAEGLEEYERQKLRQKTGGNEKPVDAEKVKERLEYLRGELKAERISYDGLHELQSLAAHIDPGDVELLEPAGVPEQTGKVVVSIIVDLSKIEGPGDVSAIDSVRHWIENETKWPDYFYSVDVKEEGDK